MKESIKPFKMLSSKTILSHPRVTITEDTILLPTGTKSTYVRRQVGQVDSVIMIAINDDGCVLVQREYSYPPNIIMWQLPVGAMHQGESIPTAAQRELAEESGYNAQQTEIVGSFYTNNRFSDQQQHIVLCTKLYEHKLPADEDEFIETHWMKREELLQRISEGSFNNINLLAALNVWFCRNLKA